VNHDVLLSFCYWGITNLGGDVLFVKIKHFKWVLELVERMDQVPDWIEVAELITDVHKGLSGFLDGSVATSFVQVSKNLLLPLPEKRF
jgi:hypothetical protein